MFPACCFCQNIYRTVLLMEYSVRLELTCVCSLNGFQLVMSLHIDIMVRVFANGSGDLGSIPGQVKKGT